MTGAGIDVIERTIIHEATAVIEPFEIELDQADKIALRAFRNPHQANLRIVLGAFVDRLPIEIDAHLSGILETVCAGTEDEYG